MIHLKRYLTNSECVETTTKKLRTTSDNKKIKSCFEDLSNELYYEIFDYLEGCHLYEAFSNLNIRFQNLISSSSIRLKIYLYSHSETTLQHRTTNIIIPNKHQIISLTLPYMSWRYYSDCLPFNIDSSFSRLESLILYQIKSNELIPLLVNLISLPRLFSLTIHNDYEFEEIHNVYQVIFNLPMLKYNKLSFFSFETYIPLTIANNQQFTKIEYLNINHCCALNELIIILSYTPQLSHLICTQINDSNNDILEKSLRKISTLIHISIDKCYADFDELEIFITKVSSVLQILRITCFKDVTYLDADRWKRIISQYLIYLHTFEFRYEENINNVLENTPYHILTKQFNSSFWIKRNWIFRIYIDTDIPDDNVIIYSIFSYKKTLANFHKDEESNEDFIDNIHQNIIEQSVNSNEQKTIDYSIIRPETNQLTITDYCSIDNDQSFIDMIGPILSIFHITCLDIICNEIFIGILIDLIKYLPNLDLLIVFSLVMMNRRCLSVEEARTLRLVSNNNKITKMKLRQMNKLAEVQFFFELCPQIQYVEVNCTIGITPEEFVRFILMKDIKYVPNLSSLCFNIFETKENIVEKLKNMIDLEQLRHNYTIKQKDNRIYLRWNLE